jgi:hypothetical protein
MPPANRSTADRPATVDRLNVPLISESAAALARAQERSGLKKVDIANRALQIYEFIDSEIRAGKQLILRDDEGREQLVKMFL